MRVDMQGGRVGPVPCWSWRAALIVTVVFGGAREADGSDQAWVSKVNRLKRGLNTGFEVRVKRLDTNQLAENGDLTKWVLYFEGLPIDKMVPKLPSPNASTNGLPDRFFQFEFAHENANPLWRELFARAGFVRESEVTVGPLSDGGTLVKSQRVAFKSLMIPDWRLAIAGVSYFAILGIAIVLATASPLLKEETGHGTLAFSLGRTQMAFWFFVVLGAYLFIGVMTGSWIGTIGTQALALMGISATTGIAAAILGKEKRQQLAAAPTESQQLKDIQGTLQTTIENPANTSNVPVLVEQLKAVGSQLAQLAATQAVSRTASEKEKGFWRGLASDAQGIALHRFQIIIWSLVLGVVFLVRVGTDLVMPELDPTTLALMGISSGTYLGFKFPEKT